MVRRIVRRYTTGSAGAALTPAILLVLGCVVFVIWMLVDAESGVLTALFLLWLLLFAAGFISLRLVRGSDRHYGSRTSAWPSDDDWPPYQPYAVPAEPVAMPMADEPAAEVPMAPPEALMRPMAYQRRSTLVLRRVLAWVLVLGLALMVLAIVMEHFWTAVIAAIMLVAGSTFHRFGRPPETVVGFGHRRRYRLRRGLDELPE